VRCASCNTLWGDLYLYLYQPAGLLQASTGGTGDRQLVVLHTRIIMLLTHGDMVFLCNLLICICMYIPYVLSNTVRRLSDSLYSSVTKTVEERRTGRCWIGTGEEGWETVTNEVTDWLTD
jgi:hypothetical protein